MASGAFALYLATLAPTVLWGDDAELQRLAAGPEVPGAGRGHLLWLWLARLAQQIPWGEPAWKANLVSAVFGAGTVGLVHATIVRLGRGGWSAILGSAALAVCHTFWLHSVRAEVYTLQLFLQTWAVLLALSWSRRERTGTALLCGLVAGLGLFNHLLAVVALPAVALAFWPRRGRPGLRGGLALSAGFLAAAVPWLVTSWPWLTGDSPARSLESLDLLAVGPGTLLLAAAVLAAQMPLGLPVAALGWLRLRRDPAGAARVLTAGLAASLLFGISFQVRDQYVFFLPALPFIALLTGAGARRLMDLARGGAGARGKARRRELLMGAGLAAALVGAPVGLYAWAPAVLEATGHASRLVRDLPGRGASFFLWPPKAGYRAARTFAEEAFRAMPRGSVILADWTLAQPMLYLQRIEGRRGDITVKQLGAGWGKQAPFLEAQASRRPVFLAARDRYYDLAEIRQRFRLEPAGPVFRLRLREAPRSRDGDPEVATPPG